MQSFKQFRSTTQAGQAIVLIAFLMVILLGATGLAIDGGGLFLLYRDAQNATDAAALSAAYAMCTDGDIQFAGINAARLNGFINDNTDTVVTVSNPPISGDYAGDLSYVQVSIFAEKPSYFIQVVYGGPLVVNVDTVAHCNIGIESESANGPTDVPAIWAGAAQNECSKEIIDWSGANTSVIGGIHSNGNINNGSSGNSVSGGPSTSVGTQKDNNNNINFSPSLQTNSASMSDPFAGYYNASRFMPGGDIYQAAYSAGRLYYTNNAINNFGSCTYNDGTPCKSGSVVNDGLIISNHNTESSGSAAITVSDGNLRGDGGTNDYANVTFVALRGRIEFSGSSNRFAPYIGNGSGVGVTSNAVLGSVHGFMAISYLERTDQSKQCEETNIYLGGSDPHYAGLVYSPQGLVELNGGQVELIGCVLGYTVKVNGSQHDILCDDTWFPDVTNEPPSISITK